MSTKSDEFYQRVLDELRARVKDPYGWLSDVQYLDPELSEDRTWIEFSDGGRLDIFQLAAMMTDLYSDQEPA